MNVIPRCNPSNPEVTKSGVYRRADFRAVWYRYEPELLAKLCCFRTGCKTYILGRLLNATFSALEFGELPRHHALAIQISTMNRLLDSINRKFFEEQISFTARSLQLSLSGRLRPAILLVKKYLFDLADADYLVQEPVGTFVVKEIIDMFEVCSSLCTVIGIIIL